MAGPEPPYKIFRIRAEVKGKDVARKVDRALRTILGKRTIRFRDVKETDSTYEASIEFYDPAADPDTLAILRGLESTSVLPRNPRDRPQVRVEASGLASAAEAAKTSDRPDKPKTIALYQKSIKALEAHHRQILEEQAAAMKSLEERLRTAQRALEAGGASAEELAKHNADLQQQLKDLGGQITALSRPRDALAVLLEYTLPTTSAPFREAARDYDGLVAAGDLDLFQAKEPLSLLGYIGCKYGLTFSDEAALGDWIRAPADEPAGEEYAALKAEHARLRLRLAEAAREVEDFRPYLERSLKAQLQTVEGRLTAHQSELARQKALRSNLAGVADGHRGFLACLERASRRAQEGAIVPILIYHAEGALPSLDVYVAGESHALAEHLRHRIHARLPVTGQLQHALHLIQVHGVLQYSVRLQARGRVNIPADHFAGLIPYVKEAITTDEIVSSLGLSPLLTILAETKPT